MLKHGADGLAAQALDRLNVTYDGVVQAIRQVVTIDEDADVSEQFSTHAGELLKHGAEKGCFVGTL